MIDLKDFELFQVSKSVFLARIPWDTDFLFLVFDSDFFSDFYSEKRYPMEFTLQKPFRFSIS